MEWVDDPVDQMTLLRRLITSRPGRFVTAAGLAVAGALIVSNLALWWLARGHVVNSIDELAEGLDPVGDGEPTVVIVPGARVFPDGRPSWPLNDRLNGAAQLHRSGLIDHVLVSGDNRRSHYDESTVMRREMYRSGVELADISVDYAGFDTWDTCARARQIFGVQRAVFVTQQRYASRAASLCRAAGLDATVLAVPNPPPKPRRIWIGAVLREPVAAVKGLFEVVVKPAPTFGGPFEGLSGSENPANPDPALGET